MFSFPSKSNDLTCHNSSVGGYIWLPGAEPWPVTPATSLLVVSIQIKTNGKEISHAARPGTKNMEKGFSGVWLESNVFVVTSNSSPGLYLLEPGRSAESWVQDVK